MREFNFNLNVDTHYDIYPSSKDELNLFLFEVIFLKCISDNFNKTLTLPQGALYFEFSQGLFKEYASYIITDFSRSSMTVGFSQHEIKVSNSHEDPI